MSGEIIDTTEVMKITDKRGNYDMEPAQAQQTDLVLIALQNKYDPAIIEKMMELAERNQKNIARQEYYEAMADFKAEAPPVKKDKINPRFGTPYTSIGCLLDTFNPYLGKHGLSISFPFESQDLTQGKMTGTVRLAHKRGYFEENSITLPIDKAATGKESGQKSRNDIQDIKSTFTYIRSILAEGVLGVAGTEATVDDDGNSAGKVKGFITEAQAAEIDKLVTESGADAASFMGWLGVDKYNDIPVKKYKEAVTFLKAKKANKEKK
jgi:hypothetical protein